METAIIKSDRLFVACSIFPVGYFGWGKSEKEAINSLNDNVYDFCNWLSRPLPKDPIVKVISKYSGRLNEVKFNEDKQSDVKKYCEVAMQSAFSFKCFIDSFTLSEEESQTCNNLYEKLGFQVDEGIIGFSAKLCENGCCEQLRNFIFNVYYTAKDLFQSAKTRNVDFSDTFCFGFSY